MMMKLAVFWTKPRAVKVPKPATRKGRIRLSMGLTRIGLSTSRLPAPPCRQANTSSMAIPISTGTTMMGVSRPNPARAPPTIAPRILAIPCTAPIPAIPLTRAGPSGVNSAM